MSKDYRGETDLGPGREGAGLKVQPILQVNGVAKLESIPIAVKHVDLYIYTTTFIT